MDYTNIMKIKQKSRPDMETQKNQIGKMQKYGVKIREE